MKKFDIVSIGSATQDAFLKSEEFPLDKNDVGGKIEIDNLYLASGGGGSNVAAGFSRLGLWTACVARFGDDLFGQFVYQDLKKEKFSLKYLLKKKGDFTDYSTILVNPDGSRTILVHRGKTRIEEKQFPWSTIQKTEWFYLASLEGNVELLLKVVQRAFEKKVKVALNPGSRELKTGSQLAMIFPKLKVLILNEAEAKIFAGESESQKAFAKVARMGAEITVITCGRQGAYLFTGDRQIFAPIFVVETIDETGAGDAFSAGFVAGLVKEWELEKCLKLGVANGASVVSKVGAKPGLLRKDKIDFWLKKPLSIKSLK